MSPVSLEQQRFARILEITCDLSAIVSLEQLLHKITQAAVELTDTEMAGILLFDEPSGELRFMTATHLADKLLNIPVPLDASIAGTAFTSRAPVIVPEVADDPRYYRVIEEVTGVKAHSLLAVPLQFQARCIGVLEIENKRSGLTFNSHDAETVLVLAAQAAIAIENARLVDSLERERQLAESFRQVSVALNSTLNYNEVLAGILEQINVVIPGDAANIMMLDRDGQTARVFLGRGYGRFGTAETLASTTMNIDKARLLRQMQNLRQPLAIADVERHPDWIYSRPEHTWIKSYVGAPIFIQGQIVGFLSVLSATAGQFGPAEADRLQTFSHHAAIAIQNAQLYQQAQLEIAERTRAEAEVRRHRDHLEELVDERVAEIKQINAELQQQNAELDAFAQTVAHDLKNPLSAIIGYAGILAEEFRDASSAVAHTCSVHLVTGSRKMARIIDELLLLSSVRRQSSIRLEELDTAAIVQDAQERVGYLAEQSGAEISAPLAWPLAVGYPAWVEEVWTNYLSNAIKYGGRPPQIELGATVLEHEGMVRFWVRDNGAGLTPEDQLSLFTEFTRLYQPNTQGHGLGLSIVRRIIERLGGQVGVESEPNHGSVFFFTLPLVPADLA